MSNNINCVKTIHSSPPQYLRQTNKTKLFSNLITNSFFLNLYVGTHDIKYV